jgi:hypothetical protein
MQGRKYPAMNVGIATEIFSFLYIYYFSRSFRYFFAFFGSLFSIPLAFLSSFCLLSSFMSCSLLFFLSFLKYSE